MTHLANTTKRLRDAIWHCRCLVAARVFCAQVRDSLLLLLATLVGIFRAAFGDRKQGLRTAAEVGRRGQHRPLSHLVDTAHNMLSMSHRVVLGAGLIALAVYSVTALTKNWNFSEQPRTKTVRSLDVVAMKKAAEAEKQQSVPSLRVQSPASPQVPLFAGMDSAVSEPQKAVYTPSVKERPVTIQSLRDRSATAPKPRYIEEQKPVSKFERKLLFAWVAFVIAMVWFAALILLIGAEKLSPRVLGFLLNYGMCEPVKKAEQSLPSLVRDLVPKRLRPVVFLPLVFWFVLLETVTAAPNVVANFMAEFMANLNRWLSMLGKRKTIVYAAIFMRGGRGIAKLLALPTQFPSADRSTFIHSFPRVASVIPSLA